MNQKKSLDQFFTHPDTVDVCINRVKAVLMKLPFLSSAVVYEPSAGDGVFIGPLSELFKEVRAFDIDPRKEEIKFNNWLVKAYPGRNNGELSVVIGNPPFGQRGVLAKNFFNASARNDIASIIAFVVPVQFRKWSIQSKLNHNYALISDDLLREDSFVVDNKRVSIRCCFQVWINRGILSAFGLNALKLPGGLFDMRLKQAPAIVHEDFLMYQYNNTEKALDVFTKPFDFAVPRQGYKDYSRREVDADKCEKTTQWVLFKARTKEILARLDALDFNMLAKRNTTIPGFGKADIISYYNEVYSNVC